MRKYVHWLKIDGYTNMEETAKHFQAIEEYLKKYNNSSAILFQYDNGSFNWIVKLECNQCYNDLDIDVNSFSTRLKRLRTKPKNIGREKVFSFPEHYKKYII